MSVDIKAEVFIAPMDLKVLPQITATIITGRPKTRIYM